MNQKDIETIWAALAPENKTEVIDAVSSLITFEQNATEDCTPVTDNTEDFSRPDSPLPRFTPGDLITSHPAGITSIECSACRNKFPVPSFRIPENLIPLEHVLSCHCEDILIKTIHDKLQERKTESVIELINIYGLDFFRDYDQWMTNNLIDPANHLEFFVNATVGYINTKPSQLINNYLYITTILNPDGTTCCAIATDRLIDPEHQDTINNAIGKQKDTSNDLDSSIAIYKTAEDILLSAEYKVFSQIIYDTIEL